MISEELKERVSKKIIKEKGTEHYNKLIEDRSKELGEILKDFREIIDLSNDAFRKGTLEVVSTDKSFEIDDLAITDIALDLLFSKKD